MLRTKRLTLDLDMETYKKYKFMIKVLNITGVAFIRELINLYYLTYYEDNPTTNNDLPNNHKESPDDRLDKFLESRRASTGSAGS